MSGIRSLEELVAKHHKAISQAFKALQDDLVSHERHNREQDPDDEDYQYYVANIADQVYDLKAQVEGTLSVWHGNK
ncbi:hypothetical protein [Kribbella endophytica]